MNKQEVILQAAVGRSLSIDCKRGSDFDCMRVDSNHQITGQIANTVFSMQF